MSRFIQVVCDTRRSQKLRPSQKTATTKMRSEWLCTFCFFLAVTVTSDAVFSDMSDFLEMSFWMILPASLPLCLISGVWIIYAVAVHHRHVCPLNNWTYNSSCEEPLVMQTGYFLCCTLDDIPLVSKCGVLPPESCWFSLLCSTGSFMVMLIVLLRFAEAIHRQKNSLLNMLGLCTGWLCATGLIIVGNFQVDFAKVLHYVGAGLAFPTSLLYVCVQSVLTYSMAKTHTDFHTAHLRLVLSLLAFVTLVTSGVFFMQESFVLQHTAAVCEWIFILVILIFFGSFMVEFRSINADTLLLVIQRRTWTRSPQGPC